MPDLTWTVTAPYRQCLECRHPGPPAPTFAMTITQPACAIGYDLIPHYEGCSAPNPYNGPSIVFRFHGRLDRG